MDQKMKSLPRSGPSLARMLNCPRTLFKARRTFQTHRSSAAWTSPNLRRLSSWWTASWRRRPTGRWRASSKIWTPAATFSFLLPSTSKVCPLPLFCFDFTECTDWDSRFKVTLRFGFVHLTQMLIYQTEILQRAMFGVRSTLTTAPPCSTWLCSLAVSV